MTPCIKVLLPVPVLCGIIDLGKCLSPLGYPPTLEGVPVLAPGCLLKSFGRWSRMKLLGPRMIVSVLVILRRPLPIKKTLDSNSCRVFHGWPRCLLCLAFFRYCTFAIMVFSCALPNLSLGDWCVRRQISDADILVRLLAGLDSQPSGAPHRWT